MDPLLVVQMVESHRGLFDNNIRVMLHQFTVNSQSLLQIELLSKLKREVRIVAGRPHAENLNHIVVFEFTGDIVFMLQLPTFHFALTSIRSKYLECYFLFGISIHRFEDLTGCPRTNQTYDSILINKVSSVSHNCLD